MAKKSKASRGRIIKRTFGLSDQHLSWVTLMGVSQERLEWWRQRATDEGVGLPHIIEREMAAWRRERLRLVGKPVMVRLNVKIDEELHRRVMSGCQRRGVQLDRLIRDFLGSRFGTEVEAVEEKGTAGGVIPFRRP